MSKRTSVMSVEDFFPLPEHVESITKYNELKNTTKLRNLVETVWSIYHVCINIVPHLNARNPNIPGV